MESFNKIISFTEKDIAYSDGCRETATRILRDLAAAFPKEKGKSSSHVKIHRFIDEVKKRYRLGE